MGKTMQEVLPPDIAQVGMQAIEEARTQGLSHGKQYAMDLPQGRFHFELSVAAKLPVGTPNNRYVFIARNVSERVENEENLKKEAQRNAALIQLSQHDESTSLQARAQRALSSMVPLTGSTLGYMASISTQDRQGHPLGLYANGQAVEPTTGALWSLRDGDIWDKAIREHRPVVLPSTGDIPAAHGLPETLGNISNWVAVPVFEGKHLVMLVGVGNKAHPYTEADVEFLHLMAYNFWQITHKLETDFALRRFLMATAQSPNPVMITDPQGRLEYVNEAFTRVTGYRADEVMGRNPRILQSGRTEATVYKSMWSQLLSGQAWSGELINRRKNGQDYYEDALIYPIRNDMGVVTHYLAHKQDITERKSTAERIQYLSEFDQLTGLPNRALLIEQLQFEIEQSQHTAQSLMVLWLNLDLFKDINDTYGHETGDSVLREVARRLRTLTKGRDLVARYSGDNFIIMRENTDQFGATRLAAQLFEALIRWRHPQLGDVSPGEFIPLVETAGLSAQLGEWVLQHVLADLRQWLDQNIPIVKIALNLSATQFVEADLATRIQTQLEQSGVPTQWVELELTEVAAMKNPAQTVQTLSALSALGLSLSIDDFGTGYSSLSQLKRFEVHKLKIDQSFVRDVAHDTEDQAIVIAIIQMAHSLGMSTLAEGVETTEQLDFLKSHQCDHIQGYIYSRPLEKTDFEQLLRSPRALDIAN